MDFACKSLVISYLNSNLSSLSDENAEKMRDVINNIKTIWGINEIASNNLINLIPDQLTDEESANDLLLKGNMELGYCNFDEAIKCLDKAIEISPNNETLYLSRASCFMKKYYFAEAIVDCEKVIDLNKNNVCAYLKIIFCFHSLQMVNEAKISFYIGLKNSNNNDGLVEIKTLIGDLPTPEETTKLINKIKENVKSNKSLYENVVIRKIISDVESNQENIFKLISNNEYLKLKLKNL